ncbi:MAG: hypothetical protein Q9183_001350, partial [Haloplaca sp. 2 TL-2023]
MAKSLQALGFQSLAGETKIRLLPSPWPANALPPTTASLLSIASRNGLLAAGGPEQVVIASTQTVREAYRSDPGVDGNVKSFTPQLTLELGIRPSQVAFSADESYLVVSAEHGGGLAVYEVQKLTQGSTQSTFEVSTNDTALRTLLPNPTPEKAELLAVVTTLGELLMVNLATRQVEPLQRNVSCISWSPRGKQLVAGLADGSCCQLTPEGTLKATIPRPPDLEGDQYVSALSWLENDIWLVAHTPAAEDDEMIPATTFHIVVRQPQQPQASYMFQKLPEPAGPFGMKRLPPYHFMQRLRNYPPSLTDVIVVSSTASADVGLFTRAEVPLSNDVEAARITKTFTTTTMANDTRRAQLPVDNDAEDTSPIGMALDLSATETVPRPLPSEEMDESKGPLPALMILNNEGILTSWWIVYAESVRQGTMYTGLVAAGDSQPQVQPSKDASPLATSTAQSSSPFTSNAFGSSSAQNNGFPKPAAPAFGTTGQNTAFGASTALGTRPSPWGSGAGAGGSAQSMGASFGAPAFGSSTPLGANSGASAFGAVGGIGNRPSPWAGPASGAQSAGSVFGQSGNLGIGTSFALGSGTAAKSATTQSSGGFASFASGPGFAASAARQAGESPFAKAEQGASIGSGMDTDSPFGAASKKVEAASSGLFGSGDGFKLGSTFKGDGSSANDGPRPPASASDSLFGGTFGRSLENTQTQPSAFESKETDMIEDSGDSGQDVMSEASHDGEDSLTPAAKPKTSPFGFQHTTPPVAGGLFGTQAQSKTTPALVQSSTPTTLPPTKHEPISTTPEDTPKKPEDMARPSIEISTPQIKREPQDGPPHNIKEIPEGPLPPDPTSKDSYSPGDTSQSSASGSKSTTNDAPLPPDFIPSGAKEGKPGPGPDENTALPNDDDSDLDDEGSGVDVAQEISPDTDPTRTPKITPGSSFGVPLDKSPQGLFSSKGHSQANQTNLFGEVGKSSHLCFPPPSKTQESPRSPSPIRSQLSLDNLRPDNARSISAPNAAAMRACPNRASGAVPNKNLMDRQKTFADEQKQEQERRAAQRAKQIAEEQQSLSDEEDENIRNLLETEVEATTVLEDFIAHEDYSQGVNKQGVPGQTERVYRDINSMIDTIGLNARNLEAFVKGHSELDNQGPRSHDDLEGTSWCLGEVEDLFNLEEQISAQVEDSRISDVDVKVGECQDLRQDQRRLKARQRDISKALDARSESNQDEASGYGQLSVEQASQQKKLRDAFKGVQKLTAEAERKVFELRADVASKDKSNKDGLTKKPT